MPLFDPTQGHSPQTTRLFEMPIPSKRRALTLPQGKCTSVQLALLDANGDAYDLSNVDEAPYTVGCAVRESMGWLAENALFDTGVIDDATTGQVTVPLPGTVTQNPGLYLLEVVLTNDTLYPRASSAGEVVETLLLVDTDTYRITTVKPDTSTVQYDFPAGVTPIVGVGTVLVAKQQLVKDVCVLISNVLYLAIERGIHGVSGLSSSGPPTLAEIRLHLRDFPETNLLLDDYEFDEAEIALATERVVLYFNESPPRLSRQFTTQNFPYRYHWLEGITYYLYLTAAAWHRRNRLPYSAGGVSIDDLGKEQEYLRAAMMHEKNYKEWAQHTKVSLNMEEGFASFGSDYSSWGY